MMVVLNSRVWIKPEALRQAQVFLWGIQLFQRGQKMGQMYGQMLQFVASTKNYGQIHNFVQKIMKRTCGFWTTAPAPPVPRIVVPDHGTSSGCDWPGHPLQVWGNPFDGDERPRNTHVRKVASLLDNTISAKESLHPCSIFQLISLQKESCAHKVETQYHAHDAKRSHPRASV